MKTELTVAALICMAMFACLQTDMKQEDAVLSKTPSADEQTPLNKTERSDEEETTSLLEFLQTITNGSVPIESLTEIPFEWETPVQEMVQLVQKYGNRPVKCIFRVFPFIETIPPWHDTEERCDGGNESGGILAGACVRIPIQSAR